jgi:hypothetical protein
VTPVTASLEREDQNVGGGRLMVRDKRNLLDVLKFELEFLEQGG